MGDENSCLRGIYCDGRGPEPGKTSKNYQNTGKSLTEKLILYCTIVVIISELICTVLFSEITGDGQ